MTGFVASGRRTRRARPTAHVALLKFVLAAGWKPSAEARESRILALPTCRPVAMWKPSSYRLGSEGINRGSVVPGTVFRSAICGAAPISCTKLAMERAKV